MKLHSGLVLSSLLSLGLLTYACANGDTVSGSTGSGGSNSSGNTGGSSSNNTGGSSNSNTGGNNNTTGSTGGSQGSGGVRATGGATGGSNVTGAGTGGTTTTGSTGGTTGTTGAGGSASVSCGTSFSVNAAGYVTSPGASGTCLHGYAYNFDDALGSTIMPGTTMTYATCGTPCKLTAMGMVAAATMANNYATYAGIGFNLNQDQSGGTATPTLTPKGTGLTVAFSGTAGTLSLRAQITDGTKIWCYSITGASPVTIPYSSFNTQCWPGGAGIAYAKDPINAFQLQAAGAAAADSYNLTLTSVTEN